MKNIIDEESLHYHAMNFRGAPIGNADFFWKELEEFVYRKFKESYNQGYSDAWEVYKEENHG